MPGVQITSPRPIYFKGLRVIRRPFFRGIIFRVQSGELRVTPLSTVIQCRQPLRLTQEILGPWQLRTHHSVSADGVMDSQGGQTACGMARPESMSPRRVRARTTCGASYPVGSACPGVPRGAPTLIQHPWNRSRNNRDEMLTGRTGSTRGAIPTGAKSRPAAGFAANAAQARAHRLDSSREIDIIYCEPHLILGQAQHSPVSSG